MVEARQLDIAVSFDEVIETIHGFKMHLNPLDDMVCRVLRDSKEWEGSETYLLSQEITEGQTVVDVGAHIGYFTLLLSKLVGPKGSVYAFEPNPYSLAYLRRNVAVNNCRNVVVEDMAVYDRDVHIQVWAKKGGNTGDVRIFPTLNGEELGVDAVMLDTYFSPRNVDFIKMDVQGAEYNVLKGAGSLIQRSPGLKMMVEYSRDLMLEGFKATPEQFLPLLEDFEIYDMSSRTLRRLDPSFLLTGGGGNLFCKKKGAVK